MVRYCLSVTSLVPLVHDQSSNAPLIDINGSFFWFLKRKGMSDREALLSPISLEVFE